MESIDSGESFDHGNEGRDVKDDRLLDEQLGMALVPFVGERALEEELVCREKDHFTFGREAPT